MNKLALSILAVAVSGCSSWPEHGHGGDTQVDTSHDYYIAQVNSDLGPSDVNHTHFLAMKGHLETQWSLHSLKLDTLVLRGSKECLPARVREVSMMARRSRRELDGNLLEDAQNSIVVFHREIDELERRLIYIKRHTQCDSSSRFAQNSTVLNEQQKYLNRKLFLINLLNDDYSFDSDSDDLTAHYREKLVIAAQYLKQEESLQLFINGHTDSEGDYKYNQLLALKRANQVKSVLVNSGVDESRLISRSFGEQLPLVSNSDPLGRMKNRRVTVEFVEEKSFYIPGRHGQLFDDEHDLFGFDSDAEKVMKTKHWNKSLGEEWNHEL